MSSVQNVVITGANTGIGKATAVALAGPNRRLFLACRSEAKTQPVLEACRKLGAAEFVALDLSSLQSVRTAAVALKGYRVDLHVLINNAGLAGQRGLTQDGFELTFGVNHLGHYLWTELLLDQVVGTPESPARIVNVASMLHYKAKRVDWNALQRPTRWWRVLNAYAVSKLCNVLHSNELSRRLATRNINTYSLHPGGVASDVYRALPQPIEALIKKRLITTEEGSVATLHCAASEDARTQTGLFYWQDAKVRAPNPLALDERLQHELEERSRSWVAQYL